MFDLLAVATQEAIHFEDLGLTRGIDLGFFTLRFYSLAYLAGILAAWWHLSKMTKAPGSPMAQRHVDDLFFYCTLGVIIGGRLGYAAFYKPDLFTGFTSSERVSWDLLRLWDGGMSFHGGVIGTTLAIAWVSWRGKLSFIRTCDYISVNVGFGMFFGRIANFINGELWGRPTDVSWAMIFPSDRLGLPRHPSQLYEAVLEGLLIIAIMLPLFWRTRARYRPGLLVGTFTVLIASARFVVEFFREPDEQLVWMVTDTGLSRGQWLSIPLILAGLALMAWSLKRPALGSGIKPAAA
ncbi:prolipoprotein diacylglyceryl transferase [Croceibacterium sp. LX-88]|jgi:phosphatidylglycerol:prolipoprotein diacylglycerol transferase|uniref:Phosphatidylglycerol--prolipoprotein diacylglyceryl transferase n=1 Tax=Croceibacterium selenioxidans TaxID=2838833 RepID=A0ABS5W8T7_9SPHN|nr:prolipoprotein diacylglyceryl transferase [Croceibacterium selenioxidans]MBT2135507.1 prolipoprotein diacylglyceryl transferase [Croceibacterium selenioxidans]